MKFGRFNNIAKNMVDDLLRIEDMQEYAEAKTTTVSVKMDVTSAAMLTVLSELFGQSRYAFTGEILEDFTADLFFNLPEAKRAELAAKADQITTEQLAKQGITITGVGPFGNTEGDQTWRMLNVSPPVLEAYAKDQAKERA